MNIVSGGSGDLLLTGNPTKSFFKTTYSKYTPFGIQMFRIDYEGRRSLNDSHPTSYTYKVPRYGDLLYDSYLCVTLPNVFSDYRCNRCYNKDPATGPAAWAQRQDYQFAWVADLGYTIIEEISVSIGGAQIMRVTGEWSVRSKYGNFSLTQSHAHKLLKIALFTRHFLRKSAYGFSVLFSHTCPMQEVFLA